MNEIEELKKEIQEEFFLFKKREDEIFLEFRKRLEEEKIKEIEKKFNL